MNYFCSFIFTGWCQAKYKPLFRGILHILVHMEALYIYCWNASRSCWFTVTLYAAEDDRKLDREKFHWRMQIHTFRTESSEGMVTMQTIYTYIYIYFFIMLIEKIIWVHSAHHNIYRDIVLFSRSWMNCREKLAKKVEQWTDAPNVVGGKKMLPMDYPDFREKYVQPLTL